MSIPNNDPGSGISRFSRVSKYLRPLLLLPLICTFAGCNVREVSLFKKLAQSSDEEITRQTEEAIKKDPDLQELNRICMDIPLPQNSHLVRKGGPDDQHKSIWVLYKTPASFDDLERGWLSHFQTSTWRLKERRDSSLMRILEFESQQSSVEIQYGGMGESANVAFGCKKP